MQADLHEFLSHLAGTVAMSLAPVVLTVFLTMPSTLHHHIGHAPADGHAPVVHPT